MKKTVSLLLSLAIVLSMFSTLGLSAFAETQKYLVDMIKNGEATVDTPDQYTEYQCNSSGVSGAVRIGDGTENGYVDYTHGFRYHSATGGASNNISFTMPAGYNTLSGVVGVCHHVPGVASGSTPCYCEECYITITVNSSVVYTSPDIKIKTPYNFNIRAKEGSNVIISVVNPTTNGSYNHIIFGDPIISHNDYPDIEATFDKPFYREGETATVNLEGSVSSDNYETAWYIDGEKVEAATGLSYTVTSADMGKTLSFNVTDKSNAVITAIETFLSKIPIVSITTESGKDVTSKEDYINADFKVLGMDGNYEYNGLTEIRGRGNTSWGFPKKSYKIKLDKKTNLFGMGKNKHWTLISCYWDENFLRNKMSYDISGELGLTYAASEWVDVYLNGKYHGVYLLCEHLRIDDDRVEIFDWEALAGDVAKAVSKAEPDRFGRP